MTIRKNVSVIQNSWHDAQNVDQTDMNVEQNRNTEVDAATIQNHLGSGIIIKSVTQPVLFDSDILDTTQSGLLVSGNFDGTGLSVTAQPSDINLGNQLEVELTGSDAFGRLSVKLAIIGLGFDDTMQIDKFYFHTNEKQVTSKHYKKIICIFTNDFKGNNNCSRSLGGRLIIRETESFQLSKNPIMTSQESEPDLFWRDFKKADPVLTLTQTIQNGLGADYTIDSLNITASGLDPKTISANDITTQVGQKFLAKTNNIQKISLLLGVSQDLLAATANQFDWAGDLVITVYALQNSIECPTDIVPSLAIDFDPSPIPIVQLSYSQITLREYGYVLNNVPQPVDFVFNNTAIGAAGGITTDQYYCVTVRRSGAATSGDVLVAGGSDRLTTGRATIFSAGTWVDLTSEDFWFQVWTDAGKLADGQGYDSGYGVLLDKTTTDSDTGATTDSDTGATIDLQSINHSMVTTGENSLNIAVIQAAVSESITVQDERTGNPVFSRKQSTPSLSFVSSTGLASLQDVGEPLIIGGLQDANPKANTTFDKVQIYPGSAKGDKFYIINPDADLLSMNLIGSKLFPNINSDNSYRIFKVTSCVDGYGDVNGDGVIDTTDVQLATLLIGESIYLDSTQTKILNGDFTLLELLRADVDGDGYITVDDVNYLTDFVTKVTNGFPVGTSFTHLELQVQQSIGRNDGYFDCVDGYVRLDGNGSNTILSSSLTEAELIFDGYNLIPTIELDSVFTTVPFASVTYRVQAQPFWASYLVGVTSSARQVPVIFTESTAIVTNDCSIPSAFSCTDRSKVEVSVDPGRNDYYVPDNLIIGKGEILRPDGSNYSVDFEVGTVILQLPAEQFVEAAINIFDKFVADWGSGFTRAGYPAMRYSDCTTVQDTDLAMGKVRFGVSVQSYAPNLDGYSDTDGYVVIVDPIIGCHIEAGTGILTISLKDLSVDPIYSTLVTKIQIQVLLKKAGWKNEVLVIDPNEVLGLIS